MKFLLSSAALLLAAPLVASAQSNVTPGLWSYDAMAALGPIPFNQRGEQCIDRDLAGGSYESLLNQITDDCAVVSGSQKADGYHFTMVCSGEPKGQLTGHLAVNGNTAQLNATGWTGTERDNVPVVLSASATRLADTCQ